jgi:hypothetical protein
LILSSFKHAQQHVLGISSNISITDLLADTNKQRAQNGLPALVLNQELDNAAMAKAQYMYKYNFWAHNAPDGTTPWVFIRNAGYPYVYAGENLARGYFTADDVVNAWMASPGHRENILSGNYHDIGFAVMAGNLTGEDTVLVVQMFGSQNMQEAQAQTPSSTANFVLAPSPSIVVEAPVVSVSPTEGENITPPQEQVAAVSQQPLINSVMFSKNLTTLVLLVLLVVLVLDILYMRRKQVTRLVAHNLDHILFLGMILLLILFVISKGVIL